MDLNERYNPVTDTLNLSPSDKIDDNERLNRIGLAQKREMDAKRRLEEKRQDAITSYEKYEDDKYRIEVYERQQRMQEEYNQEQERLRQERQEDLAEKQRHIREAKARYDKLSFFKKLFTKKIDSFKQGFGYYKSDDMSIQQIDNLYQGKSR